MSETTELRHYTLSEGSVQTDFGVAAVTVLSTCTRTELERIIGGPPDFDAIVAAGKRWALDHTIQRRGREIRLDVIVRPRPSTRSYDALAYGGSDAVWTWLAEAWLPELGSTTDPRGEIR